jgi:hypothetical protein
MPIKNDRPAIFLAMIAYDFSTNTTVVFLIYFTLKKNYVENPDELTTILYK